jgi:hypothetical protein
MACTGTALGCTVLRTVLCFENNNDVRASNWHQCCVVEKLTLMLKRSVNNEQRRFHRRSAPLSPIRRKSCWCVRSGVACPQKRLCARTECCPSTESCPLTTKRGSRGMKETGDMIPCIINLSTRWRWAVSFTPWPVYSRRKKNPLFPVDGPKCRCGNFGEEKSLDPACQWATISRSSSPYRSHYTDCDTKRTSDTSKPRKGVVCWTCSTYKEIGRNVLKQYSGNPQRTRRPLENIPKKRGVNVFLDSAGLEYVPVADCVVCGKEISGKAHKWLRISWPCCGHGRNSHRYSPSSTPSPNLTSPKRLFWEKVIITSNTYERSS